MAVESTQHQALCPKGAQVRLDKWLWAARFFKTRGLATQTVVGGHVHVNGLRSKASYHVRMGDEIRIRKTHQEWVVIVRALSEHRRPALEALALYEETPQSQNLREEKTRNNRLLTALAPRTNGRLDKRDRRKIRQLLGRDWEGQRSSL